MRIAQLNVPFPLPSDPSQWITVPPQGYGGIQWVVATLIDGLLALGCEIALLGAPGSPTRPGLEVVDATELADTRVWLADNQVDIVHDHTNGAIVPAATARPRVSTFHLTGVPKRSVNCIYVSRVQRRMAGSLRAVVIPLPVNPDRYLFRAQKQDYLVFIGRVSRHKGATQAAAFAVAAGLPLKVAGPSWEPDYMDELLSGYPDTVEYMGEVGGQQRLDLIANARAVMVMSQPVRGPFGTLWSEPGATVVSEAAVSGTPVVSSANGCLPEIVPGVGIVLPYGPDETPSAVEARRALAALPDADEVRSVAVTRWGHETIAKRYIEAYERVARHDSWE